MRKTIFAVMALLSALTVTSAAAETFVAGKHYKVLDEPLPVVMQEGKTVAVWEYFSYLCGHCFNFEKPVLAWAAKLPTAVQFEQVPAIFNSSMIPGAQTYHALQVMGVDKDHRVSQGIYDAIHLAGIPAKNLGHYTALVKNLGVDADLFTKTASSFTVNVRVNQSKSATYGSRLEGTPSLLVAGKYMIISNEYVPGFDAVLAVADFLIAQELAK